VAALAALVGYVAVQLLVPLRHHLYVGDPNWTEAGHTFAGT
jgi:vitamin K-dependent gamma-carboxylase